MTEKALEQRFVKWCQSKDIIPIKGPSMIVKGIPDRYIQLPNGGGTVYVEFKGTSYYGLQPMQEWWKKYLTAADPHRYFLIENLDELEAMFAKLEALIAIGPDLVSYTSALLAERCEK